MEKASLWVDTKLKNLNEVRELFLANKDNQRSHENAGTYTDFDVKQKIKEDQSIVINGQNWLFNKFDYSYLYKSNDDLIDPQETSGYVVAFSNGDEVRYFINYFSQNAQVSLQLLLNNLNKATHIESKPVIVKEGFFLWLFQKYYNGDAEFQISNSSDSNNSVSNTSSNLNINSILAVKGDTSDQITSINASGDQISNYVSVLSFLLESSKLYKLGLRISYDSHKTIEFTIDKPRKNNVVSVDISKYEGVLSAESMDSKISKLLIIVNLVIFPKLIQMYMEDETWNQQEMEMFFDGLSQDITSKIATLLKGVKDKVALDNSQTSLDV